MSAKTYLPILLSTSALFAGCAGDSSDSEEYDFSSREAVLVEMEFDGELVADSVWNAERLIEDQLLYTIGHLNGDRSVGRLDKLELSNVERTQLDDGRTKVTYHAMLPVGWGNKNDVPSDYTFKLPRHVDHADYQAFTAEYKADCVDWSAHDVDTGSMWYYYRPNASRCELSNDDVFTAVATVTVSDENTSGKFPEYHKVWEDDALTVVAIFGKYEDGATSSSDAGISAYNKFVSAIKSELGAFDLSTVPADVPNNPGVGAADITFKAQLADGKTVEVVALLVDNVRTAGWEFNQRYASLSGGADMIFYNGHAGLGDNIRSLAKKGEFKTGKYQMFFMNGCDTFAYVDDALAKSHADVNPDDPSGTRYLDMITNVMPSFFRSMPNASMALVRGMLSYEQPLSYEDIFASIDRSEVVVVTGEEDNVYFPGFVPGGGSAWEGIAEHGSVGTDEVEHYSLGTLPAGQYVIVTAEDATAPGGDVDLYVALGRAPSLVDYDHRPYLWGSDESVTITLQTPTEVFVMIHGYEAGAYLLSGSAISE